MTQLIRSIDGAVLRISKTRLTEVKAQEGYRYKFFAYLKDLGEDKGGFDAHGVHGEFRHLARDLSMNWADQHIGCQYFDVKNFSILKKAIRAALKG